MCVHVYGNRLWIPGPEEKEEESIIQGTAMLLNVMFMTTIENECFEIWSRDCVATKETRRAKDFKQKANTYTPVLVKQASR
jgi:hypothetical protein